MASSNSNVESQQSQNCLKKGFCWSPGDPKGLGQPGSDARHSLPVGRRPTSRRGLPSPSVLPRREEGVKKPFRRGPPRKETVLIAWAKDVSVHLRELTLNQLCREICNLFYGARPQDNTVQKRVWK